MRIWRVGLASFVLFLASCTKPNPKSCIDGTCTTEEYPFCDVDGSFAGEPQTCISVECEPNAFAQCRGDDALSCNATGNDYETKQCPLGCQDDVGCRVCQPNEAVCANGAVQTCDAGGNVVSSQSCALGCFEDEPRCRNIDPSNALAQYAEMEANPPDLDLSQGGSIATLTGAVGSGGSMLPVPTHLVAPPPGGVAVRVLVVNNAVLGNVDVTSGERYTAGPALAIVAKGTVTITGVVSLWYDSGREGAYGFAGGIDDVTCRGGPGQIDSYANGDYFEQYVGSGGGGHATRGGRGGRIGGDIDGQFSGGKGGLPSGSPALIPLRGGCAAGGETRDANQPQLGPGPSGGGAIQIVSNVAIDFDVNATINASGSMGAVEEGGPMPPLGGGAGGGILLEAPTVTLGRGVRLLVNGGPGPSGFSDLGTSSFTSDVALGGRCGPPVTNYQCSNGGNGAALNGGANDTPDLPRAQNTPMLRQRTGAGGGGLGFIRINTSTGEYAQSTDAILSGMVSKGTIRTR